MTTAILSFATPARVTFRCDELLINERRDLDGNPPFAEWSELYATGYWNTEALLGLGLTIGRWFDGPQLWLTRLTEATAPVILEIETSTHPSSIEKAALDAPWELLARLEARSANSSATPGPPPGKTRHISSKEPTAITELLARLGPIDFGRVCFLALDPGLLLTTVRRLGSAAASRPPSRHRLSVVFMAAQPDGLVGLAVDREEVAIRRAAGSIGIDLAVEDSGSLDRLGELAAETGECDVIHISCHGSNDEVPTLALEGELGERRDTSADDLSLGIGKRPRLLFVSACSSAGAAGSLWSLSADLCRRGWPAVLGWSSVVTDSGAIELASALYRQLALRVPLADALAQARAVFAGRPAGTEWHKARLFLGPGGGGAIVEGTRRRLDWPDAVRDAKLVATCPLKRRAIDAEGPFPYRRAFQSVMAVLRNGYSHGVIIHGADEHARETFAARVLQRLERDLRRVVVTRDFDAPGILDAIRRQTASPDVDAIARRYNGQVRSDPGQLLQAVRAIVEGPCRGAGDGAVALTLHGFGSAGSQEAQLEQSPSKLSGLPLSQQPVAQALVGAFVGARTASRLLFTTTTPFSVDIAGCDLFDSLLTESPESQ